jgi:nitroimidazol reductase NimA-like FMN-containing flavoprotein (pyridoxamine 5'-phosphate oxidase superfamily)
MPFDEGLTAISRDECMELLATTTVGRVGVSVDALPAILPVTIAMMDDAVVFRTIPGTKLAAATTRSVLAIEADRYDPRAGDGWSVLVRGIASELASGDAVARARRLLQDSWIGPSANEHYVQVACDLVTGRRLCRPVPSGEERS